MCTHADSISRGNNVAVVPVWLGKKAASSPEKSTVTIRVGELGQRPGQVLKLELAKTTTIAGVKQAACLQRYVEHGSTVLHNHMSVECSHGPRLHRPCTATMASPKPLHGYSKAGLNSVYTVPDS